MRVPEELETAFKNGFQEILERFAAQKGLIPEAGSLGSERFLARSVIPHVQKLSSLFNREENTAGQGSGLDPYWKESSNPGNLRLAYFLSFMPCNLFRVASIWSELGRLGFRWPADRPLNAIEFGAGPAAGACGIAAGERFSALGLSKVATWALIEQEKAVLQMGADWASHYFAELGFRDWGTRSFHRKIQLNEGPQSGFLPRSAPRFNLWVASYFLNEFPENSAELAESLVRSWDRHLDDEGLVIIVEPALRAQSRRLLEVRRELLKIREKRGIDWLQVLLPCLGHQACGALESKEDWCHEEVSWWRPPYIRKIDEMAKLDRKTLPFSYLVIAKSLRPRDQILPALAGLGERAHRLVSPAHLEGRDSEFFICGKEGKRRARYRAEGNTFERGDILLGAEIRGDSQATRIEKMKGHLGK